MTLEASDLEVELQANADTAKRDWWTNYVKGARFYGVPMADVRRVGIQWWQANRPNGSLGDALVLCAHPYTEVRLTGIAVMERILIPEGRLAARDLATLRSSLDDGALADWNTCDWFCVKVLNVLMDTGNASDHHDLLEWLESTTVWTKRSSLVGFVTLLADREPSPGFDEHFVSAADTMATDRRRFCQTALGWTMRELSVRRPEIVESYVNRHLSNLSRESVANAVKKLDSGTRTQLLKAHKAT